MNKLFTKIIEISEKPLDVSTIVGGKYLIIDILGKGSYGFTYLVKDHANQIFVLKQLRKYKQLDHAGIAAFNREANILKNLDHPAFPTFYEQFVEKQKQFIVMEYLNGKTYEELIFQDKQIFSESDAFKELYSILLLVKHIHEKQFVHRDLRIPNILKNNQDYYIIDFGLTRHVLDQNNTEKIDHLEKKLFREVAFKSDIYALGHFLLFLLYSSYVPVSKKKMSWEEELYITGNARRVLRKMLQIDDPYYDVEHLLEDVKKCI